jgi:hypothetical protein
VPLVTNTKTGSKVQETGTSSAYSSAASTSKTVQDSRGAIFDRLSAAVQERGLVGSKDFGYKLTYFLGKNSTICKSPSMPYSRAVPICFLRSVLCFRANDKSFLRLSDTGQEASSKADSKGMARVLGQRIIWAPSGPLFDHFGLQLSQWILNDTVFINVGSYNIANITLVT